MTNRTPIRKPPKAASWLLRRVNVFGDGETTLGDFEEGFAAIVEERNKILAVIWYWLQLLLLLGSYIWGMFYWRCVMFRNYVKIAYRTFKRYRVYSFINIAGLGVAVACCMLILVYISHELSYDRYHQNAKRIFRVCSDLNIGGQALDIPKTSPQIMNFIERTCPEIAKSVKLHRMGRKTVRYEDRQFYERGIFYAENTIFDVFKIRLKPAGP